MRAARRREAARALAARDHAAFSTMILRPNHNARSCSSFSTSSSAHGGAALIVRSAFGLDQAAGGVLGGLAVVGFVARRRRQG